MYMSSFSVLSVHDLLLGSVWPMPFRSFARFAFPPIRLVWPILSDSLTPEEAGEVTPPAAVEDVHPMMRAGAT